MFGKKPYLVRFLITLLIAGLLASLFLVPSAAATQNLTFIPVADSYVDSSQPGANFGSATTLRVDGSPIVNSYLRFSVSGVGAQTISQVRLLIHANSGSSQGLVAKPVADNTWGEATLNYSNAPATGSSLATSGSVTSGAWVTLDVTGSVTGDGSYSFGVSTPGVTAISLSARESGANAPQLIVTINSLATPTDTPPAATNTPSATSPAATSTPTVPSPTATNTPTATTSPTATSTPTVPSPTATNTPTATTSPTATSTPTLPSSTPTNTPTATASPTATSTPTVPSPTATNTPTATASPTATNTSTATLAAATSTPTISLGQSLTFVPVADSYVDSSQPNANFGTATTLRVDASPSVNSYLRFSVVGAGGRSISRVRLLVRANSTSTRGLVLRSVANNTWGETTIKFSNAPAMGSSLAASAAVRSGTWITLDVTGYVTGNGTFSFGITTPGFTAISLAGREIWRQCTPIDRRFGRSLYPDTHKYLNQYAYEYACEYSHRYTDEHIDQYAYQYACEYSHQYTDEHIDQYAYRYACEYSHQYTDEHIDQYTYRYAHKYTHRYACKYRDSHADIHTGEHSPRFNHKACFCSRHGKPQLR